MKKRFLTLILIFPLLFISACSLTKETEKNNDQEKFEDVLSNRNVNQSILSTKLGLKIEYYSDSNNEIFSKEEGNKIYFWNEFQKQSIEVFVKDKNVSFEDSVVYQFLNSEFYKNNCFVDVFEDNINYKKAIINFRNQNPSGECISGDPSPTCDSCPEVYSKKNASDYFIYYKNNPNKYFYISLGQESLMGSEFNLWYGNDDSREWFNNIMFIDL